MIPASKPIALSGFRLLLTAAALLFLAAPAAHAGRGDKVGTASGVQLVIPVGARSIALGGAVLSTVQGVEAIHWNPAGLSVSPASVGFMISHMTYISDVDVEYLALGKNLGGAGSIGLSIKTLGVGEIPVTTETSPDGTGESISPTYLSGGLTYSRMISDRIAAGFSATLLHESMGDVEATNIAFTAGVTYTRLGGIEGLSVAVVIRNIGPPMTYGGEGLKRTAENEGDDRPPSTYMIEAASADLPSSVEVGLGYAAALDESFVVQTSGLFQNNNFSNDEYKVGVELGYLKRFFLRGGYLFQGGEGEEYIYGVTAGVGAGLDLGGSDLTLDYAYRQVTFFTGNHVIALHLAFD